MNTDTNPPMENLYRAAVGDRRADYYVPRFMRFDEPGASRASWNWPAFFVAFFWGLYRRMYGSSLLLCLLMPYALLLALRLLFAFGHVPYAGLLTFVATIGYSWVIIPMYANAFYHRFIVRRINAVREKVADPAVQITVLENGPHTSSLAWVIAFFALVPMTGILMAIAIPAYQDYIIRAQVQEGLNLAAPLERAIAASYSTHGSWPANLAAVKFGRPVTGTYVDAIEVASGTIVIRYGSSANQLIADQALTLRPTLSGHDVVWTCGYGASQGSDPPSGASGPGQTTLPMKFLPQLCRS
jgi:Tfp pilus assembly major pilin PilA